MACPTYAGGAYIDNHTDIDTIPGPLILPFLFPFCLDTFLFVFPPPSHSLSDIPSISIYNRARALTLVPLEPLYSAMKAEWKARNR